MSQSRFISTEPIESLLQKMANALPISRNDAAYSENEERNIKIQSRQDLLPNSNKNVCNRTSILEDNRRRRNSHYKIILATL